MILLLGSTGLLGQAFSFLLRQQKKAFLAPTSTMLDVSSPKELNSFFAKNRFSHVINCTGYTQVDQAELETKKAYLLNRDVLSYLLEALQGTETKIVHFSTDYLFDGRANQPYVEEAAPHPLSVYGLTKYLGEKELQKGTQPYLILRTSWLFGGNRKNFVSTMLEKMQQQKEIFVVDDQWGRPTYALDLARATLLLLEDEGCFHVANSGVCSWYDFAQKIMHFSQKYGFTLQCNSVERISSETLQTKAKRPSYSVLDINKFQRKYGAMRHWENALEDYIQVLWNKHGIPKISL